MPETPANDDSEPKFVIEDSKETKMSRAWYVWRMNYSKDRIKPATKAKQRQEYEDAVIAFAEEIKEKRTRGF